MSKDNFISFSFFTLHPYYRQENQGNVYKAVRQAETTSLQPLSQESLGMYLFKLSGCPKVENWRQRKLIIY